MMGFKNLSCDEAREMGAKVRELADIFCRKCNKHSELVEETKLQKETIKLLQEAIKQKDTEIDILIRKKEALRDEIEEVQIKNCELAIELQEMRLWEGFYKADIERLQRVNDHFADTGKIKSEVIKEFAERLKISVDNGEIYDTVDDYVLTINHINSLVKEMMEGGVDNA